MSELQVSLPTPLYAYPTKVLKQSSILSDPIFSATYFDDYFPDFFLNIFAIGYRKIIDVSYVVFLSWHSPESLTATEVVQ